MIDNEFFAELELDTAAGPRVTYAPDVTAEELEDWLPPVWGVDYSGQVQLANGCYRAPLVRKED